MAAYITVGAKTSHGGTVITGSPQTTHNGVPIARKGDKVMCKKCEKVVTIITGDPAFVIDGAPVARAGDMTSCGSKLIAVQQAFVESDFDVGSIEPPAPLKFPKSEASNFSDKKRDSGNDQLDTSKFYIGGDDLQKSFDKIISTSHGRYIVATIQKSEKILAVSIRKGNKQLGKTIPKMESIILEEPEWWEIWKPTKMADKIIMKVDINMNNEDPYFVRADGRSLYKPTMTEVLAHELGHIKNYIDFNTLSYKNLSIAHQNTIMRQLDREAIIRHPNKEHGGGFAD